MTENTTVNETTDTRSVETAWAERLAAELPVDTEDGRRYANFLFGNPLFTTRDIEPDAAVVLIDELLDRHTPMSFLDIEGYLTTEEWAVLKEDLVVHLAEGVDGERPGPASAFPDAPALEQTTTEETVETVSPETTTAPETTEAQATTAGIGVGLADEGFDPDKLDMAGLYDAVVAVIQDSELDDESKRATIQRLREALKTDDVGLELYVAVAQLVLASTADVDDVDRSLKRVLDRDLDRD